MRPLQSHEYEYKTLAKINSARVFCLIVQYKYQLRFVHFILRTTQIIQNIDILQMPLLLS